MFKVEIVEKHNYNVLIKVVNIPTLKGATDMLDYIVENVKLPTDKELSFSIIGEIETKVENEVLACLS